MLHETIHKLRETLLPVWLIAVILLAPSCAGSATSTSTEPGITPATAQPDSLPTTSSPVPQFSSGQRLRFERISIEQGLSHSTVNCILQDSKGFMWLGTNDGLNRYDGHDFTLYKHDLGDSHSLSHKQIKSLHQDRFGTLWVGTVDRLGDDWHLGVRYNQGIDYVNLREIIRGI